MKKQKAEKDSSFFVKKAFELASLRRCESTYLRFLISAKPLG
jgi:hypothetical protein